MNRFTAQAMPDRSILISLTTERGSFAPLITWAEAAEFAPILRAAADDADRGATWPVPGFVELATGARLMAYARAHEGVLVAITANTLGVLGQSGVVTSADTRTAADMLTAAMDA